jgi:hypothetical protein
MQSKPSVGRIVHFTSPLSASGKPLAAIVTGVNDDDTVSLTVFPPGTGELIFENVPCAPNATEPARGYWNWPPRT